MTYRDHLEHHGILGQKWGVRRYQNLDGSLTEEGKKRYGNALGREVYDYDRLYGKDYNTANTEINKAVKRNKAVKDFNKHSQEYKELKGVKRKIEAIEGYNDYINTRLTRKYGEPMVLLMTDSGKLAQYLKEGKEMMNEFIEENGYQDVGAEYSKASAKYEEAGRKWLDNYLGEYGSTTSISDIRLTYNTKTKEIGRQTMKDIIALEMLRNAGGKI